MTDQIAGINRTSLWNAWREIRKSLKNASVRDVIDFLEHDIDPNIWINRLLRQVKEGSYEPSTPRRFTLAKTKGFSRTMTFPAIPDLVLYRTILDKLYAWAKRSEHKHVYFERKRLSDVTQQEKSVEIDEIEADYGLAGFSRFMAWKLYDQYRKYLIFTKVYPFIVTTDVTNFFDSVLYSRISDSLQGLSAPRSLLRLEPKQRETNDIRNLASNLLSTGNALMGHYECAAIAPLIMLRFADRRSLPRLRTCLENKTDRLPPSVIRSAAIVYLSYGQKEFREVRRFAARLFRNNLSEVVRLVERIMDYDEVPGRYKARLMTRNDPVAGAHYFDMRSLVSARLLSLNRKPNVKDWLITKKKELLTGKVSSYDKFTVSRLLRV